MTLLIGVIVEPRSDDRRATLGEKTQPLADFPITGGLRVLRGAR
jgi:hypothetical protein